MQKLSTSVGEQDGEHMLSFFCCLYFADSLIEKGKEELDMWEMFAWPILTVAFILAAFLEGSTHT